MSCAQDGSRRDRHNVLGHGVAAQLDAPATRSIEQMNDWDDHSRRLAIAAILIAWLFVYKYFELI